MLNGCCLIDFLFSVLEMYEVIGEENYLDCSLIYNEFLKVFKKFIDNKEIDINCLLGLVCVLVCGLEEVRVNF